MYSDLGMTQEGEQYGIHIIGQGNAELDGGNPNDLREATSRKDGRPHVRFNNLILLHNVRDYSIENLRCTHQRWWAINQICCRRGYINRIDFFNGDKIPNQDGINLRIGCHEITIENITGRTGDDVVALTALPMCGDGQLLVEGRDPDIHDVTIRNVCAHTMQTVVALRNCDGAQMYRITIENITDCGGPYFAWGVVRIGENNYYKQRPNRLGETREITVRGVKAIARGTVYIASSLKDSHISDVWATGTTRYGVSTFLPSLVSGETKCWVEGGVTMENVVVDNIHYCGSCGNPQDRGIANPGEVFDGAALDFRCMRDSDSLKNVVFRDIFAREGAEIAVAREGIELDIRN